MLQVPRDEVRIHRGAPAEGDFEEDDVVFVGKGFLGMLPRQEDGLFPKTRDERFGFPLPQPNSFLARTSSYSAMISSFGERDDSA